MMGPWCMPAYTRSLYETDRNHVILPNSNISLKGVQCFGTPSMFGHGLIMVHTSEVARRKWKPQENTEENKRY